MSSLEAIRYSQGQLHLLDQLKLPTTCEYFPVRTLEDGWNAIRNMQVRGAPAIGIVGCLTLALQIRASHFDSLAQLRAKVGEWMTYLVTSRPTAVNLQDAQERIVEKLEIAEKSGKSLEAAKLELLEWLESRQAEDVALNRKMAQLAAEDILRRHGGPQVRLLTYCNTGALATGGYGTALGVARCLHDAGQLAHIFCCETRPYNQGARLTAFEIVAEGVPGTLICDNMAAALMARGQVDAVVVGADRIVSNGDFANKIGTYQLAIVAKHHQVPFYVIAPVTSFDFHLARGDQIVIEERKPDEVTFVLGRRLAAQGIEVWNPAFDVTPAELVTGGIVCEFGVFKSGELRTKLEPMLKS